VFSRLISGICGWVSRFQGAPEEDDEVIVFHGAAGYIGGIGSGIGPGPFIRDTMNREQPRETISVEDKVEAKPRSNPSQSPDIYHYVWKLDAVLAT
jgi:hypothetical protein